MFFWFIAFGVLSVLLIFKSRGVDYRFVAAGSVLPLIEGVTGRPWVMHTLAGSVALLLVVMLATIGKGKKLLRRQWIGLPIGTLMFLLASSSWQRADLFWWPWPSKAGTVISSNVSAGGVTGFGIGHGTIPEFDRSIMMLIFLEIVGVLALCVLARKSCLHDLQRRRELWKHGRLTTIDPKP